MQTAALSYLRQALRTAPGVLVSLACKLASFFFEFYSFVSAAGGFNTSTLCPSRGLNVITLNLGGSSISHAHCLRQFSNFNRDMAMMFVCSVALS